MNSPKKAQPRTKAMRPAAAKSPCISMQSVIDALHADSDEDDGFFLSPLKEELTDEEARKIWRSGSLDRDL